MLVVWVMETFHINLLTSTNFVVTWKDAVLITRVCAAFQPLDPCARRAQISLGASGLTPAVMDEFDSSSEPKVITDLCFLPLRCLDGKIIWLHIAVQ